MALHFPPKPDFRVVHVLILAVLANDDIAWVTQDINNKEIRVVNDGRHVHDVFGALGN